MEKKFFLKNNWVFGIVLVGLLIVFGLFFYNNEVGDKKVTTEIVPQIEVEELGNGEKLVRNVGEGYQFEVPSDWPEFYFDGYLEFNNISNYEEGSTGIGGNGCKLTINRADFSSNLEIYASNFCKKESDCESYKVLEENGNIYSVAFFGFFIGSGVKEYYFLGDNDYYTRFILSCSDESLYNNYVENIINSFNNL